MSKQVKIGIVGTSWWTDSMYMPALTKHPISAREGRRVEVNEIHPEEKQ